MNTTFSHFEFEYKLLNVLGLVEPYYILCVILIGFISNSITFFIFAWNKLKIEQVNSILASLALVDNCFLLALLVANLKIFKFDLFNQNLVVCKLTVYFTYVSSFLSVWLIVFFTIERFLAVYFPFKRCSMSNNKRPIILIILFTLTFHSFTLFTSGLEVVKGEERVVCVTLSKWFNYTKIFALVDATLTIIVPFLLIFVFNFLIINKLNRTKFEYNLNKNGRVFSLKSQEETVIKRNSKSIKSDQIVSTTQQNTLPRNRKNTVPSLFPNSFELIYLKKFSGNELSKSDCTTNDENCPGKRVCLTKKFIELKRNLNQPNSESSLPTSFYGPYNSSLKPFSTSVDSQCNSKLLLFLNKRTDSKKIKFTRTTYVLLMISFCFILLNMPMAICKVWYFITETKSDMILDSFQQNEATLHEELFERVSCYIYYLNFCINFFLYNLNLLKLRKLFLSVYLAKKFPKPSQSRQIESTQLVPNIQIRKSAVSFRL